MKKSLVLAMAMALGVTASAYAANPFSDVPAGHWAYDAVNKLAAEGVVDGYTDGTYGGDKLMTRYEMAQIVAKAMAKGANVDKLAAEFADELDSLGVRVANLEKKADNFKIAGNIRAHNADYSGGGATKHGYGNNSSALRTRLLLSGQINEDWTYQGRLENKQKFNNAVAEDKLDMNRAFVQGRLGGLDVRAGRTWAYFAEGNIFDENLDGIIASYGKDIKIEGVAGRAPKQLGWNYTYVYGGSASAKFDKLTVDAGYYKFSDADGDYKADEDNKIWHAGLNYNFGDVRLGAMYLNSSIEDAAGEDDGYVVTATYKGAKASKVGSYGLVAQYFDQPGGTTISHTMNGEYPYRDFANGFNELQGFEGYKLAGYYTVAKNMVLGLEWHDFEGNKDDKSYDTLWSQLIVTF